VGRAAAHGLIAVKALGSATERTQSALRGASTQLDVGSGAEGSFLPLAAPVRLLDTRRGLGAAQAPLGPGASIDLQVTGVADIPTSGVSAVVLNVTAVTPTTGTYITVWPTGATMPYVSNLNLAGGAVRPNLVTVKVGSGGQISLYNANGSVNLVADVQGFYSDVSGVPGGFYHPVTPNRSYDSRWYDEPWLADETWAVPVDAPGLDLSTLVAVAVNITVTRPTTTSYLTAFPGFEDPSNPGVPDVDNRPLASNVNFVAGQSVSNLAIVPVAWYDADTLLPLIFIYNRAGSVHVIIDVQGWYDDGTRTDGLRFQPVDPVRIRDTRSGIGGAVGAVVAGSATTVPTASAAAGAKAVVANITGTQPTTGTYLTAWPGSPIALPYASTLNLRPKETAAALTMVPTAFGATDGSGEESFAVFNANGSTQVVADIDGYFY
jgi:hypothetical protein